MARPKGMAVMQGYLAQGLSFGNIGQAGFSGLEFLV